MKVKEAIEALSKNYSPDDDICISWWDIDLFKGSLEDAEMDEKEIVKRWGKAVDDFDKEFGYDFINSQVYDILYGVINEVESY